VEKATEAFRRLYDKSGGLPSQSQVIAATKEPAREVGYLINFRFCYKGKETRSFSCGCPQCHPEFWCKHVGCDHPVEARLSRRLTLKREPSLEYCFQHSDGEPSTAAEPERKKNQSQMQQFLAGSSMP